MSFGSATWAFLGLELHRTEGGFVLPQEGSPEFVVVTAFDNFMFVPWAAGFLRGCARNLSIC